MCADLRYLHCLSRDLPGLDTSTPRTEDINSAHQPRDTSVLLKIILPRQPNPTTAKSLNFYSILPPSNSSANLSFVQHFSSLTQLILSTYSDIMSGQFPTQGAPPSYDQPYASDASFAGFDQQHTEGPNEYTYLSDEYDYSSDESDYSSEDNVEAIVQRYDDLDYITVLDNWISSNMNPCCAYCQRVRCQSFRAIIKEFDFTNDELLEAFKDADALFAGDISDSHTLNRVASKTNV
ncbi:hypothetical protein F5Y00DRAFT_228975 [Daldinia vernicosa]|uniref:uncharacterized protein n=1 Tax=Daldinia vernicosa TaxID=114800 RepID=UPI002008D77D|nr:uncharacterized protein F5Y00DRAFT_228975 [Daldinia vernicosa]KAI0851684.1 hypothetical protein F5Y00DRAFT_228975 [Daldinia vernicosa]